VTPATSATSATVCAYVANKPYVKVFGGDLASGSGLINSGGGCTGNANATIVGWNKRNIDAGNLWAGAGSQYAALALNAVRDFGTTQLNGGAPAPSGLAFANSGVSAIDQNNGTFGNSLGAIGCMPDYYATMPSTATTVSTAVPINLNALASNAAYKTTGNTTISTANFGPGERKVLFVDGDAYINGNITYTGNWNASSVPLFELVVRGNLFIAPNVSQLDGVYIAQQRADGTKGYAYTCTNPASAFSAVPLDGNLYNLCDDTRLTVNGVLAANRVYLLRTLGTLRQSTVGESRTSGVAAETFNYNPAVWIAQPTGIVNAAPDEYDSITSLPPIL